MSRSITPSPIPPPEGVSRAEAAAPAGPTSGETADNALAWRQTLGGVRSVVVKLGTQLLSDPDGRLDTTYLASVARQVSTLRRSGLAVTLVSSGALGAGLAELDLSVRPADLARLQAVAAIGQRRLMDGWSDAFEPCGLRVAQLLLTREDFDHRTRFLNLRNTIVAVHDLGGVPIVNENDTVSTDELVRISFGDNDLLASGVASAVRADVLVLLSVTDGLAGPDGRVVSLVRDVGAVEAFVRPDTSARGRGGMASKLAAARHVTAAGESLVVAHGRVPKILERVLLAHEPLGTLFVPRKKDRLGGRNRWIAAVRPCGTLAVDAGAARAIVDKSGSLLAVGIRSAEGEFVRGDVVRLLDPDGRAIAQGLINYDAADTREVCGLKTAEVRHRLAGRAYDEVIHRDNLVLL